MWPVKSILVVGFILPFALAMFSNSASCDVLFTPREVECDTDFFNWLPGEMYHEVFSHLLISAPVSLRRLYHVNSLMAHKLEAWAYKYVSERCSLFEALALSPLQIGILGPIVSSFLSSQSHPHIGVSYGCTIAALGSISNTPRLIQSFMTHQPSKDDKEALLNMLFSQLRMIDPRNPLKRSSRVIEMMEGKGLERTLLPLVLLDNEGSWNIYSVFIGLTLIKLMNTEVEMNEVQLKLAHMCVSANPTFLAKQIAQLSDVAALMGVKQTEARFTRFDDSVYALTGCRLVFMERAAMLAKLEKMDDSNDDYGISLIKMLMLIPALYVPGGIDRESPTFRRIFSQVRKISLNMILNTGQTAFSLSDVRGDVLDMFYHHFMLDHDMEQHEAFRKFLMVKDEVTMDFLEPSLLVNIDNLEHLLVKYLDKHGNVLLKCMNSFQVYFVMCHLGSFSEKFQLRIRSYVADSFIEALKDSNGHCFVLLDQVIRIAHGSLNDVCLDNIRSVLHSDCRFEDSAMQFRHSTQFPSLTV